MFGRVKSWHLAIAPRAQFCAEMERRGRGQTHCASPVHVPGVCNERAKWDLPPHAPTGSARAHEGRTSGLHLLN